MVVVGADGVVLVDMAVPRGRERGISRPLGRARFLEVGESPPPLGLLVEIERGSSAMARRAALVRGSLLPPRRVVEVEHGPSADGWRAPSLGCGWQPGRIVEGERGLPARGGFAPTLSRCGSQGQPQMSMGPPWVKREIGRAHV